MSGGFDVSVPIPAAGARPVDPAAAAKAAPVVAAPAAEATPALTPATAANTANTAAPAADPAVTAEGEADRLGIDRVDFGSFREEFRDTGKLSEESYEKLAKSNFAREDVDLYLAGVKATQETNSNALYAVTGGKEEYGAMIAWASQPGNLTTAERTAYNEAVNSGNPAYSKMAVEQMHSRFATKMGAPNTRIRGATPSITGGAPGYADQNAAVAALKAARATGEANTAAWQNAHSQKLSGMLAAQKRR